MSEAKLNEKELTMRGCYGGQISYDKLVNFLEDSFSLNDFSEEEGTGRFADCIWGHAGIGKCVSGDSLIVTGGSGMTYISDVFPENVVSPDTSLEMAEGDMTVHTPARDDPMKPVSHLYYAGVKPSIGLRTFNGRELIGSYIHPVKVLREDGFHFVSMPELRIGDSVCIDWVRGDIRGTDHPESLPLLTILSRENPVDVPNHMTESLASILGALVAEGNCCSTQMVVLSQDSAKPFSEQYISDCEKTFGISPTFSWDKRTERIGSYYICRKALRRWLAKIGLDHCDSEHKRVPWSIMQASRDSQVAFLKSYYEGDGSCESVGICATSASKELLRQIQFMLLRFEILASLSPKMVDGKSYWNLMITGKFARKMQSLIQFSRAKTASWLSETETDQSNKDGVPAGWAYEFLCKMKDSHLKNGGHLGKEAIHSYPLNSIYGRSVSVDRVKMWTKDKVCMIASMLDHADKSFFTEMDYVLSYSYERIVSLWDNGLVKLYDVCVPDGHEFDVNGIVSHNTEIVKSFQNKPVEWRGKKYDGYFVSHVPIAQFEEMGDLHGIPMDCVLMRNNGDEQWVAQKDETIRAYRENGWEIDTGVKPRTLTAPPDWVPQHPGPSILLLDDWNRASIRIIKGIMQLLQDYGMVSWKLPPGCNIVLTGNPDEQDYLVTTIDQAILTRIRHITLKHDATEWAVWARSKKLDDRLISYILYKKEDMIGRERTNPRTLAQFARWLTRIDQIEKQKERVHLFASSLLDEETVGSFMVFATREMEMVLDPEDILNAKSHCIKHITDLIEGRKQPRLDVVNVICERLYAHLVQDDTEQTAARVQNFLEFICHEKMPEDIRHGICSRLARKVGKSQRWLVCKGKHAQILHQQIMANLR